MNKTAKSEIETVRVKVDGEGFTLLVRFPEFHGPGGDPVAVTFETSLGEYGAWEPPGEVEKTPEAFIEYVFVRPTHAKLAAIHEAIGGLEGREYDW